MYHPLLLDNISYYDNNFYSKILQFTMLYLELLLMVLWLVRVLRGWIILTNRYSEELKQIMLGKYEVGTTAKAICERYGVSRSTLLLWVKQYKAAVVRFPWGSTQCSRNWSGWESRNRLLGLVEAQKFIARYSPWCNPQAEGSIQFPCAMSCVWCESIYCLSSWTACTGKVAGGAPRRNIKTAISEIFGTSNKLFDVRRIRVKLKEKGYVVSERRIGRLMEEIGLYVKENGPRLNSANDRQYQYYPNRLQGNFMTAASNMVWVSNIRYTRVGHDFLYLCVVIGCCENMV